MPKEVICSNCGSNRHYQTFCQWKKRKPIPQRGKRTELYEAWRDTVAIPYLDKRYGHVCSYRGCTESNNLDVDHKLGRGSHSHLKMVVTNVQYLCRSHHRMKTDGKLK